MNENVAFVYHHLGLGDHVICNGLVREIGKKVKHVLLACKKENLQNVRRMYRDNPNIEPIEANDSEASNLLLDFKYNKRIATFHVTTYPTQLLHPDLTFDELFYKCAGIDFQKRFDSFYIEEDELVQNEIFNELNPNNEPYIFVHDDVSRGFEIPSSEYRHDIKVVRNDYKFSVFDMKKVLQNALEIHCMPSCIHDFCNSFFLHNPMNVYMGVRGYDEVMLAKSINQRIVKW